MLQPKLKLVIGSPKNPNLRGKVVWELSEDYEVSACGLLICIPAGFQSDLASIPYAFQWLVGHPGENGFRAAALVHDWLYYVHTCGTRAQADSCLLDLLDRNGVGWIRRHAIYRAVRIAGGSYWDNDATDRAYLEGLRQQIADSGRDPAIYGL